MIDPLFALGTVVATPGALEAMGATGTTPGELLERHARGDWGELCAEDEDQNELGLLGGFRLMSAYRLPDGVTVWVITEADRSSTTFLLPDEY